MADETLRLDAKDAFMLLTLAQRAPMFSHEMIEVQRIGQQMQQQAEQMMQAQQQAANEQRAQDGAAGQDDTTPDLPKTVSPNGAGKKEPAKA